MRDGDNMSVDDYFLRKSVLADAVKEAIEADLLAAMVEERTGPDAWRNGPFFKELESELYPDGYELTVTLYIGLGHDELLEVLDALVPHDTRSVDMTILNLHVDIQESGRRRVRAVIGVDPAPPQKVRRSFDLNEPKPKRARRSNPDTCKACKGRGLEYRDELWVERGYSCAACEPEAHRLPKGAVPMPIEVGDVLTVRIEDGWGTKLVKRKAAKVTKKFVMLHDGYTKFRRYPTQTEDALSEVDGIGWIESVNGVPTAGWESGYDPDPRKARRR